MSTYAKLPNNVAKQISFNAGTLATTFAPATGVLDRANIVGATTGGSTFNPNLNIINLFEDVDNAKGNSKQGVYIKDCDPHLTTNLLTANADNINKLVPNSTVTTADGITKVLPLDGVVPDNQFFDIWVITDYATMLSTNDSTKTGFFAIHMMNCLNVNGFQQQTTDDGKVQYSCDFRAHYDVEDDSQTVPYEIYFSSGEKDETGA